MIHLNRLSLRARLAVLIVIFSISLLAAFGITHHANQRVIRDLKDLYQRRVFLLEGLQQMSLKGAKIMENLEKARRGELALEDLGASLRGEKRQLLESWQRIRPVLSREEGLKKGLASALEAYLGALEGYLGQGLASGDLSSLYEAWHRLEGSLAEVSQGLFERARADFESGLSAAQRGERYILAVFGLGLMASLMAFFLISGQIVRGLGQVVSALAEASEGHFKQALPVSGRDELARLALAFNNLVAGVGQILKTLETQTGSLLVASKKLSQVGESVDEGAKDLDRVASQVAAAAQQATESLSGVAQAVEEMTTATQDIAKSISETAAVTNQAQAKAQRARTVIEKLSHGSNRIGEVIRVINQIAEQTNLLALNATIEAARAGEAGKGFAVVANEVKELAKQTAKATEEITEMIRGIQEDTREAVDSVEEITQIVAQINDLSNTIASATEEQTATVAEINQNIQEGIQGVSLVNDEIQTLAKRAQEFTELASEVLLSEEAISDIVEEIKTVGEFFEVSEQAVARAQDQASDSVRIMAMCLQHYSWRERVLEGILKGTPPEVETDHSRCALGRWLAGYRAQGPREEQIISRLVPVHEALHGQVIKIKELIGKGADIREVYGALVKEISPRVKEVVSALKELRGAFT